MAHVSPDGRWLRINEKLCEMSGYTRDELLCMSYREMTPSEDLSASEERVRRLLIGETGPYSVERRYVRKDGSRFWVNLSVSLVRKEPSDEPDFFVCVAEDVTARKLAELVPDPLTPRETKILNRIVAGRKNPQIAGDLSLSLGTVKLEVRQILKKLEAGDRRRAAYRAVEIGLVHPRLAENS